MEIEDNLLAISSALFSRDEKWNLVTDEQKETWFFIINRYFSKKYPNQAQLLNHKSIDKISAMNLIHEFLKTGPYPKWFWSKSEKSKKTEEISPADYKQLQFRLNLKSNDIDYLIKNFTNEVRTELKLIKDFENLNKKNKI